MQIELTDDEVFFLVNFLGNMSNNDYKSIIESEEYYYGNTKRFMLGLLDSTNGDFTYNMYRKFHTANENRKKPVRKYRVLYKDSKGDYGVTKQYFESKEEFDSTFTIPNYPRTFIELVADSGLDFTE